MKDIIIFEYHDFLDFKSGKTFIIDNGDSALYVKRDLIRSYDEYFDNQTIRDKNIFFYESLVENSFVIKEVLSKDGEHLMLLICKKLL